jgi:hypothetical protein
MLTVPRIQPGAQYLNWVQTLDALMETLENHNTVKAAPHTAMPRNPARGASATEFQQ